MTVSLIPKSIALLPSSLNIAVYLMTFFLSLHVYRETRKILRNFQLPTGTLSNVLDSRLETWYSLKTTKWITQLALMDAMFGIGAFGWRNVALYTMVSAPSDPILIGLAMTWIFALKSALYPMFCL